MKKETVLPSVRCSHEFKAAMKKLAKKQKKNVSEMIRDDYNLKINQLK